MKNVLIVVSVFLIAAAHGGIAAAQPPEEPAFICAMHCERELGHTCHERSAVMECIERQPECPNSALRDAAGMILFGRMTCPQAPAPTPRPRPRVRPRRQAPPETVVAPTPVAPEPAATQPAPTRELVRMTVFMPSLEILAEGPVTETELARRAEHVCVELGGVWYPEGRTAEPSRARMVQMIENLIEPNAGPPGSPADDQTPGVCLTPEGVILERVIREILLQMRTGHGEQALQIEDLQRQIDALRSELQAALAQPSADAHAQEVRIRELEERMRQQEARYADALQELYNAIQLYRRARDGDTEPQSAIAPQPAGDSDQRRLQIPGRRRDAASASSPRLLTGERIGMFVELNFTTSNHKLLAQAESRSPMAFQVGVGMSIRLVDHLYLIGAVNAGVGLRDGERISALAQVHYRVGLLGVAANHLLLGASAHFGHRYSGNGELAEQSGTWYQLRQRGLRLDAGYLLNERGWSPAFTASLLLTEGCHADRLSAGGEQCVFDVGFIASLVLTRFGAP